MNLNCLRRDRLQGLLTGFLWDPLAAYLAVPLWNCLRDRLRGFLWGFLWDRLWVRLEDRLEVPLYRNLERRYKDE